MLIVNFVFVALFAFLAEYLRLNVFKFSNLFKQAPETPTKVEPKKEEKVAPKPTLDVEIKSQKVKELYEMYVALKSTKESHDSQKVECEKYNN